MGACVSRARGPPTDWWSFSTSSRPSTKWSPARRRRWRTDVVRAGQEASYQTVLVDPPRAVTYQVRAFDTSERDLRVANAGPYLIE